MNGLAATLSASEARTNFYTILDRVGRYLQTFTITRRGKPAAVIMSQEEVEGWQETMEILSDEKLVRDLKQSIKDFKEGKFYTEKEVFKLLKIKPSDLKNGR